MIQGRDENDNVKLLKMRQRLRELPFEMIKNSSMLPSLTEVGSYLSEKEMMEATRGFSPRMKISFYKLKSCLKPSPDDSLSSQSNNHYDPHTEFRTEKSLRDDNSKSGSEERKNHEIMNKNNSSNKNCREQVPVKERNKLNLPKQNYSFLRNEFKQIEFNKILGIYPNSKDIQNPSFNRAQSNKRSKQYSQRKGSLHLENLSHTPQHMGNTCFYSDSANTSMNQQQNTLGNNTHRNGVIDLRQLESQTSFHLDSQASQYLPIWLKSRPDFLRLYLQAQVDRDLEIPMICCKKDRDKTEKERDALLNYLKSIEVFQGVDNLLLYHISQRLQIRIFSAQSTIQGRDTISQGILILFSGKSISYSRKKVGSKTSSIPLKKNECINYQNIHNKQRMNDCKVVAETDCVFLELSIQNIQEIEEIFTENERQSFVFAMQNSEFFGEIEKAKLTDMSYQMEGRLYIKNETIFKAGESSHEMYFVYQGQLLKIKSFYSKSTNCWPEAYNQKGMRIALKKVDETTILKPKNFFGDMEMIYEIGRRASVIALNTSFVYVINRQNFNSSLSTDLINQLVSWRMTKPLKLNPKVPLLQDGQSLDLNTSSKQIQDNIQKLKQKAVLRLKKTGNSFFHSRQSSPVQSQSYFYSSNHKNSTSSNNCSLN